MRIVVLECGVVALIVAVKPLTVIDSFGIIRFVVLEKCAVTSKRPHSNVRGVSSIRVRFTANVVFYKRLVAVVWQNTVFTDVVK